jgi:hypothetical protein
MNNLIKIKGQAKVKPLPSLIAYNSIRLHVSLSLYSGKSS